jgi:hypothetical protein
MKIDETTGEILSDNGGELTLQDRAKLALKGNDANLIELAKESQELSTIKTEDNYKEIKTAENKLVKMRLLITDMGKTARDDANKFAKAVIAEEKRLIGLIEPEEERLKALRFDWDEAIRIEAGKVFAAQEEKRLRLQSIDDSLEVGLNFGDGVAQVEKRIELVKNVLINDPDLTSEAVTRLELKKLTTLNTLSSALQAAKDAEVANASMAELKRLNDAKFAEMQEKSQADEKRKLALENAPDAEKLNDWVMNIRNVPFPIMSSTQGQQTKLDIIDKLEGLLVRVQAATAKMIDL